MRLLLLLALASLAAATTTVQMWTAATPCIATQAVLQSALEQAKGKLVRGCA